MEKIDFLTLVESILSVYYHEEDTILHVINDSMKKIGTIDVTKDVKEAYKNNSFDNIVFYEGTEDNYPIVRIEYEKEDNRVWVRYYIGDAVDENSWEDNFDNYSEEAVCYLSESEQIGVLEIIKNYLSKKSK